ncbi:hypothetical protein VPHK250G1_0025 [Vibrio phage K250 g1]
MKAYIAISLLSSALTWFVCKSDPDLAFPVMFIMCFIMPGIAESCGVLKKVKL